MASGTVYQAVRTYLTGAWSSTGLAWENEDFDTADLGAWVAVEMTGTSYAQQTLGAGSAAANRWDEDGLLWLHVMVKVGSGALDARNFAKALADLFRGTLLLGDSLEFGDASIGMGEAGDDDGRWWRVSVSIAWRRTAA